MLREAARVILVRNKQLLVMSRDKFGRKYFSLIGGGVDAGETPDQALIREVREETGLKVTDPRLVYIEEAGKPFGTQYVFWCEDPGGEVALSPDSAEAEINKLKQNLYQPMWLDIAKLPESPFLSTELKDQLIKDLANGFPTNPTTFSSNANYETEEQLEQRKNG